MNDTQTAGGKVPTGYWVIALAGTVWNLFGGYDYVMTRTRNVEYLGQMGNAEEILAWIDSLSLIAQVLWPIGVWASVAGSVLMLLRSRHAVTAFLVSLVGAAASFALQLGTSPPASLDTAMNRIMPLAILAIIAGLWYYSRRAVARGILR